MVLQKINIGLVFTEVTSITPYLNYLSKYGKVEIITHYITSSKYDLIIIPDVGVSPILPQFATASGFPIPSTPVCQYVELFRSFALDYYIKNEIPVVAVGNSMCINWVGKCAIVGTKQVCLPIEDKKITQKTDDFIITGYENDENQTYGIDKLNNSILTTLIRELTRKNNGDTMQKAEVMAPIVDPPLINNAENINSNTDNS